MKKTKRIKKILLGMVLFLFLLILFICISKVFDVSAASGWVDQTVDGGTEYSKHPIGNYALDFYADVGSAWLPWNWSDNVGAGVFTTIHSITSSFWTILVYLSYFVGWVVEQAFNLNFLTDAIDLLSGNIQRIAGVNMGGFTMSGLFPAMALLLILCAGCYFAYVGMFQKKTAKAVSNLLAFALTFVLGMGVIAYSGSYLNMINEFQVGLNQEILNIGSTLTFGEDSGDTVTSIREELYNVMIKAPYLLLQYDSVNEEEIGVDRINELLETKPLSEERETIVKKEVTELENESMGLQGVLFRLGAVIIVLLCDVVIGLCVLVLAGLMISSQILFLLYVSFFPVALVFSLFPNSSNNLKNILARCLEAIMMKPGITIILMVTFSISMLCYRLSASGNFLWMMFLQILTFAVAVSKAKVLLSMMRIGGGSQEEGKSRVGLLGYLALRSAMRSRSSKGSVTASAASGDGETARTGSYAGTGRWGRYADVSRLESRGDFQSGSRSGATNPNGSGGGSAAGVYGSEAGVGKEQEKGGTRKEGNAETGKMKGTAKRPTASQAVRTASVMYGKPPTKKDVEAMQQMQNQTRGVKGTAAQNIKDVSGRKQNAGVGYEAMPRSVDKHTDKTGAGTPAKGMDHTSRNRLQSDLPVKTSGVSERNQWEQVDHTERNQLQSDFPRDRGVSSGYETQHVSQEQPRRVSGTDNGYPGNLESDLPSRYTKGREQRSRRKSDKFNNFAGRDYDMDVLENMLLDREYRKRHEDGKGRS